jgi:hypothetical protein
MMMVVYDLMGTVESSAMFAEIKILVLLYLVLDVLVNIQSCSYGKNCLVLVNVD